MTVSRSACQGRRPRRVMMRAASPVAAACRLCPDDEEDDLEDSDELEDAAVTVV